MLGHVFPNILAQRSFTGTFVLAFATLVRGQYLLVGCGLRDLKGFGCCESEFHVQVVGNIFSSYITVFICLPTFVITVSSPIVTSSSVLLCPPTNTPDTADAYERLYAVSFVGFLTVDYGCEGASASLIGHSCALLKAKRQTTISRWVFSARYSLLCAGVLMFLMFVVIFHALATTSSGLIPGNFVR